MTSLSKNFAWLTASSLLSPVFSMVLVLAISRTQGVEALGKYSLMMTVFVVGQTCASLGLPVIITREVARARSDAGRYLVNACAVTLGILLVVLGAGLGVLHWSMHDAELQRALTLILLTLVPSVLTLHGEAVLLAFERAGDFVAVNFIENVARAAVGTVLVLSGFGILAIAIEILLVRMLASGALLLVLHHRGVVLRTRLERSLCRDLLRYIPVLGTIPVVNQIYARADVFLLTWLGTWTDVGLYSAGLRLVDVARTIPPAYARALYPVLSRLRVGSRDEFVEVARRSIRNILLLVIPIALLLSGLAEPLIVLLYGPNLAAAAGSLRVLAWAVVPMALATTLAQMLFSANKQAIDLRVNIIATVVSVGADILLIPRWGAGGAAAGMLISMTLYATLQYVWVRQHVVNPAALGHLGKMLPTAAVSGCLMALLSQSSPLFAAASGFASYTLGLALTGILTRDDWTQLRLSIQAGALGLRGRPSMGRSLQQDPEKPAREGAGL